ncbi:SIR2 family protein [Phenylobacterium sp. LjRoot219]|uniref:SIR2 family protein n=1 Tax=Phenylobacterium sp. LjRoot219 TaxID=3342283 RepID=UPI003ED0AAA2
MRFFPDGPSIPDDLLLARDEGGVIFFCGAGVSRARAGLPDFFGLARRVVDHLRAATDSPARKVIEVAAGMAPIPGVGGLVPADRVFTLLEREFEVAEVRAAVAQALRPQPDADLSAHKILLDLATSADGSIRLVTTNFDLLFEDAAAGELARHAPPALPDPRRPSRFNGIIHLHGHVLADYSAASDDEFVLSSTDFGRAYLAEGWATSFIREVLGRYQIVFVGYAADDPPVQYLLEALNNRAGPASTIYAFQAGPADEAKALWRDKGVIAIPFDGASNYAALWKTLEAWAERARDPDRWYTRVLTAAQAGPVGLDPVVRGQVKHIVSSHQGAKRFAEAAPPAEWLCVFDPAIRYSDLPRLRTEEEEGQQSFDPFDAYGLDDDVQPLPPADEAAPRRRSVPAEAWNAFAPNRLDRQQVGDEHLAGVIGLDGGRAARLLPRLLQLGAVWLPKVADQPAAPWWAAGRLPLHPDIAREIARKLVRNTGTSNDAEHAWRLLLRVDEPPGAYYHAEWFEFAERIKRAGWTTSAVREWGKVLMPRLKVERPYLRSGPPGDNAAVREIVRPEVTYPRTPTQLTVPLEYLFGVIVEARRGLEIAIELEAELGGWAFYNLPPIIAEPTPDGEDYARDHGLPAAVLRYVSLFTRLVSEDLTAARDELNRWPECWEIFDRLRAWTSGMPSLINGEQAGETLLALNDNEFWSHSGQRDLLLAWHARCGDMPEGKKRALEDRLIAGPPARSDLTDEENRAWANHWILERLTWLQRRGCQLTAEALSSVDALKGSMPDWHDERAGDAAASTEMRIHRVGVDVDATDLLAKPPSQVLAAAKAISGRDFESWTERRPLLGLSELRPAKVLRALTLAARRGEVPDWAWSIFLQIDERRSDRLRMIKAIAEQLSRLHPAALAEIMPPVSRWFEGAAPSLWKEDRKAFDRIWAAMLAALRHDPSSGQSSVVSSRMDWVTAALNSPPGRLAHALMTLEGRNPSRQNGFPKHWLDKVAQLLELPSDPRRYAAVIFLHNINWFYVFDRVWSEVHLLSLLDGEEADVDVFWSGFFWSPNAISEELLIRLKPRLLSLVDKDWGEAHYIQNLSAHLLSGWHSRADGGDRFISDAEMHLALARGTDRFRSDMLRQVQKWRARDPAAWTIDLDIFLGELWPRQRMVKTPKVSAQLAHLILSAGDALPEVLALALPLLGPVEQSFTGLYDSEKNDDILKSYPRELVQLLYVILSERASGWPYGGAALVERLSEVEGIAREPKLIDLRRRLAAL